MLHSWVILLFIYVVTWAQNCQLPAIIPCNGTENICPPNTTSIVALSNTLYSCPDPLQLMADSILIQGSYSGLFLIGGTVGIEQLLVQTNLQINASVSVTIIGKIQISGNLLINPTSHGFVGIDINCLSATILCDKLIVIGAGNMILSKSSIVTTSNLCLYEKININSISNNISIMIDNLDSNSISQLNFTVFLVSKLDITIQNSNLQTVSLVIFSQSNITLNQSVLNTTARSCITNSGLGRGSVIQYQNSYCTSGSSSCGYGSISNPSLCNNIIQYFLFLSHSFPYISKGPYLSTGSGGYGYSSSSNNGRGAGGGIIFIFAKDTLLTVSSDIQASGGDVYLQDKISAGSGGTIFIFSKFLYGQKYNNISAGGGSSYNNNGSGAGGMIKISYESVNSSFIQSLWVNINEGYQANEPINQIYSNGIFYGPLCNPGQQAYYLGCQSCNYSYYSTLGDPVCRVCPISKQYEIQNATISKSQLSQCFTMKKQSNLVIWLTPGEISLLSITLYLAGLIVFTIIGAVLKKRIKKEKLSSGEEFKVQDIQRDIENAKIVALELRKSKTIKTHELMYHVHRISCFGNNTEDSPWVLSTTVPVQVRRYVLPQVFGNFAQGFNKKARWSKLQYWVTKLSILFYPFYWYYIDRIKKQKFIKLLTMLEHAKDFNLINNYDYEDKSIVTIKFSKNKDYTNCYLDFFLYERADTKYFTLASPYILYLSGEGNYLRPFYLQDGDIFYRLMFFVINRNLSKLAEIGDQKKQLFNNMVSQKKRQRNCLELAKFLRKLNTIACTLDLAAPSKYIGDILWDLVLFVEKWNRQFFIKSAVQLDLILMISRLSGKNIIDNQIHILTKKDHLSFLSFILGKINEIQGWEQSSIKIGLFVYNPEQEIPKEDQKTMQEKEQQDIIQMDEEIEDESIRQSLLESSPLHQHRRPLFRQLLLWMVNAIQVIRYFMLSHRKTHYDQYTIKFLQSLFILMQTMLVFIWSIKVQVPYVFVNLICPFVGIIWFVSDSYGFGKLYLILNSMCFVNELVTLISYSIVESVNDQDNNYIVRNILCEGVNILIVLLMMFIGNRAITHSKKLSLKKEEEAGNGKIQ